MLEEKVMDVTPTLRTRRLMFNVPGEYTFRLPYEGPTHTALCAGSIRTLGGPKACPLMHSPLVQAT